MRIGQKGFTLVEIIVSLAIMTIVAGSVGAFIVAGNNSYLRGSKELTLQEEAQLTANQMIDLIIDVEKDIQFLDSTGAAVALDGTPAQDASGNVINSTNVSELRLYNNDNVYMIRWQGDDGSGYDTANQIYLYEAKNSVTTDADGNETIVWGDLTAEDVKPALMAEHVTSFNVDISEAKTTRKVVLKMTFAYMEKTYTIAETIKLRNDLSKEDSEAYMWITGLKINPTHKDLKQGQTAVFTFEFTGDSEAVAEAKAKGVEWSVSRQDGTSCPSTISTTGKLQVDAAEEIGVDALLVTCTSLLDRTKSATATVTVQQQSIDSLTITPKDVKMNRGGRQEFICDLKGDDEARKLGVTWELKYIDGTSTTSSILTVESNIMNDWRALLTVGNLEKTGTRVLRVRCFSNADNSVSDYADIMIEAVNGQYNAELIRNVIMPYEYMDSKGVNRIGWSVDLECLTAWADYMNPAGYPYITWEVIDGTGYTFEETSPESQYTKKLKCGRNENTTVTVRASVQISATDWVYPEITIDIPALPAIKTTDTLYIASNNVVLSRNGKVTCWLEGKYADKSKVRWRVVNDVEEGLAVENATKGWNGEENGMDRRVGFSPVGWDGTKVPAEVYGGSEDKDAGTMNLKSRGYGEKVEVYAKWYINWNDEHRLILQAYELKDENKKETEDNINILAQTYLLIPRCEIYFSNNKRYYSFDRRKYPDGFYDVKGSDTEVFVQMYGFKIGQGDFSSSVFQGLKLITTLEGEKPLKCFYDLEDINGDNKQEKLASQGGKYLYGKPKDEVPHGTGYTWIDGSVILDGYVRGSKALLNEDGTAETIYSFEPGWNNGKGAYPVRLYLASDEQNEVLYLKFRDARDSSKTNERVTVIFWR